MKWFRVLKTALRALRRNPMRAVLTTLGIIIGIAAVISLMEIGNGSAEAIRKTIESMGSNNLLIMPGTAASGGVSYGAGSVMTMTPADAAVIQREAPAVRAVAPIIRSRAQVIVGNRNWVPMYIYGTTPEYLDVRDWTVLEEGENFSEREVRSATQVCILGQTLVKQLFAGRSPLGQDVRVQGVNLRVIGVLTAKGANMIGWDQDDILLLPWTTLKYRVSGSSVSNVNQSAAAASSSSTANLPSQVYPSGQVSLYPPASGSSPKSARVINVDQIMAAASDGGDIPAAIGQITGILREQHRLRTSDADDFSVRDMTEMAQAATAQTTLFANLLLAVALISLVVGGVGIMNIMLVSVTERTREIGLRMAVGARGRDILLQFLVEAILLCLCGGILGILLGRGVSLLVRTFLQWPTATSLGAIIAAVSVSAMVGLIFGFYPAWKASRLDPIEALRYE